MTITYKDTTGRIICIQTDKSRIHCDELLNQLYYKDEVLLENSFYKIIGVLVKPPMENPPEVLVKMKFVRTNIIYSDDD